MSEASSTTAGEAPPLKRASWLRHAFLLVPLAGLAELGGTGTSLDFSFKYFQQLVGLFMLPEGFKPASVRMRVLPEGSAPFEREFMWKDVVIEGGG